MSAEYRFTKDNLDMCLKALAKEYRRLIGKRLPAELTLIGGASVLVNYGFRDVTYDIDAIIEAASAMRDAVTNVGDNLDLPIGWINSDFENTSSYTPRLLEHSIYYKTFSNVLTVRTISGEYLVAMKLMAGRRYKNDISDIVGILAEHKRVGKPLSFEQIDKAVKELYDGWEKLPSESGELLHNIMANDDPEGLYEIYRNEEINSKSMLLDFEGSYPGVTNKDNVNEIIAALKKKTEAQR